MNKIGIIVAMDEELEEVKNLMELEKIETVYEINFMIGTIFGKHCVVAKSGVGKVHAARATQILIDKYTPNFILNVGVAGSVNFMLSVGDIVIANKVVQHDFNITAFGHSQGFISGIGNTISCNQMLSDYIYNSVKNKEQKDFKIVQGIIATGDIFCTETHMKEKIHSVFRADLVDMECAAMAQVCLLDNVAFCAIRSVSDIPNGKNVTTYEQNINLACKRFAIVLEDFLSSY